MLFACVARESNGHGMKTIACFADLSDATVSSLEAMDNISPGLRSAAGGALPREWGHILHIP